MSARRPWGRWQRRGIIILLGSLLASELPAQAAPRVHRTRYRIEPADGQLDTLPRFAAQWRLAPDVARQLPELLQQRGLSAEVSAALQARRVIDSSTGEGVVTPDAALLDRFSAPERKAWSFLLAHHPGNVEARWPLSLSPATLARLARRPEWQEAVRRLERWGWHSGDRLIFHDFHALEDAFAGPAERRRFFQTALGSETLFLKLLPAPDLAAAADYWQVNGRYRAIEPFLNAVAALEESPRLDVAHVLPRLARSLLNTFPPDFAASEDPGIESSFLASDYFSFAPGVERHAPGGFAGWLDRHCVPAEGPPQYGDIVVFGDLTRSPWPYAAVYIADGTVFARRPTAFGAWQFLEETEIPRLNPRLAGRPPQRYRLRAAVAPAAEPAFLRGQMPEAWRRRLTLQPLPEGPWGRLRVYDVLLAPPSDLLLHLPEPEATPRWTFAGLDRDDALRQIDEVAMPDDVRRRLLAAFAAAERGPGGELLVRPSVELVWETPRELRRRLFPFLVGGTGVTDYVQHIPFPAGFAMEEWFEPGGLADPIRQNLRQLVYPLRGRTTLSDYGALYHAFDSPRDRLSAQRAALRFSALVVLLEKPRPDEVPDLVRYWRNQQGKSLRELLASFAATGDDVRYLDIVHLLPPIGREFVNTYFLPTGPSRTPSCFWTAFNFEQTPPDDRYLVVPGLPDVQGEAAWRELMTRFDLLEAPGQLGDIIAYRRVGASSVEHVCTYIAEGLVFTKNGSAFSAPWHLARAGEVDATYLTGPDVERLYFRRR